MTSRHEPFCDDDVPEHNDDQTPGSPQPVEDDRHVLPSPKKPLDVARGLIASTYTDPKTGLPTLRRWRGTFWTWTGTRWRELEDRAVRSSIYHATEKAWCWETRKDVPDLVPWAPNRYKVADVLDALAAACHLDEHVRTPTWTVDTAAPADLVAFTNGLLHVATRKLWPHHPGWFNETAVPFDYAPAAPEPKRWLAFLDELWPDDPDSQAALAEFFGYVMSGRIDLHKILLLVGPTRAGKGVLARILKALVGDGNYAGPTLASLGTNFGLSPLIGKPLAIVSDARLGGSNVHAVVERLLSVSGEDMLTIDRKYREPWTGTLTTRFLVISNELPRFGDASGAIANRFVILQLRQSWLGRENPDLTRELLGELPGILNWALDGLARLEERGRFTEPQSSADAIVALQDLVSPVAAFVREECTVDPFAEVAIDALYERWKLWAEDNGHRASSKQTFGRDLRAVVPGLATIHHRDPAGNLKRWYRGISLGQTHNGGERASPRIDPVTRGDAHNNPLWSQVEPPSGNGAKRTIEVVETGEADWQPCIRCGRPCPSLVDGKPQHADSRCATATTDSDRQDGDTHRPVERDTDRQRDVQTGIEV